MTIDCSARVHAWTVYYAFARNFYRLGKGAGVPCITARGRKTFCWQRPRLFLSATCKIRPGAAYFRKVTAKMASTLVAAGVTLAVAGLAGRYVVRKMPTITQRMSKIMQNVPLDSQSLANNKYYRGGFEAKMSRREASLILDVSPSAGKAKVKEQFKKVMSVNHPDRGGSPYIAAKINEAKDLLEK